MKFIQVGPRLINLEHVARVEKGAQSITLFFGYRGRSGAVTLRLTDNVAAQVWSYLASKSDLVVDEDGGQRDLGNAAEE